MLPACYLNISFSACKTAKSKQKRTQAKKEKKKKDIYVQLAR